MRVWKDIKKKAMREKENIDYKLYLWVQFFQILLAALVSKYLAERLNFNIWNDI